MTHSPFIDWGAGTCSFDGELFVRLLKAAAKYQHDTNGEVGNSMEYLLPYQHLSEGECLAVYAINVSAESYLIVRQFMGDSYNDIGFPGAAGSGPTVSPIDCVVVNKNCKNREAAAEYLEYLLSTENMWNYRRDCRNSVEVVKDWEGKWCVIGQEGGYLYLLDKSDPAIRAEEMPEVYAEYQERCEQYYEEYYTYMENLVNVSTGGNREIISIIDDEIDNYFRGGQSAEHVAGVIQGRVRLYLDEQK